MSFHVIIPARFHSSRLPGKLLLNLGGMTVLERVYRQALKANPASVIIATDHETIAQTAQAFGAPVVMTQTAHPSGTTRIAEVITKNKYANDAIIVNVQGDEPFIAPLLIQQAAESLAKNSTASVATLCWPIESHTDWVNPNIVKVVRNHLNEALYFSRAPIPFHRDNPSTPIDAFRHIGLYAYRAGFLLEITHWPESQLSQIEMLEQLTILWQGHKIQVETAKVAPAQDINTAEDFAVAEKLCENE